MITRVALESILEKVKYPNYTWMYVPTAHHLDDTRGFLVWADMYVRDRDGHLRIHTTRKWYVSVFSCQSEIIQTLLKLVLTAEEHEVREKFTYEGTALFGPHLDALKLKTLAALPDSLEVRDEKV